MVEHRFLYEGYTAQIEINYLRKLHGVITYIKKYIKYFLTCGII